jgi:hypothetical protein
MYSEDPFVKSIFQVEGKTWAWPVFMQRIEGELDDCFVLVVCLVCIVTLSVAKPSPVVHLVDRSSEILHSVTAFPNRNVSHLLIRLEADSRQHPQVLYHAP